MAVRETMADIIAFVRELIQDDDESNYTFTDEQIQLRLDMNRLDVYGECLTAHKEMGPGNTVSWFHYSAALPMWENDYRIQNSQAVTVIPDTPEPLIGKFSFDESTPPPLFITGKVYNVYRVAATLLTSWIGSERKVIQSWTADGTTIQRAGRIRDMMTLVDQYYSLSWNWGGTSQIKLVRKDQRRIW